MQKFTCMQYSNNQPRHTEPPVALPTESGINKNVYFACIVLHFHSIFLSTKQNLS